MNAIIFHAIGTMASFAPDRITEFAIAENVNVSPNGTFPDTLHANAELLTKPVSLHMENISISFVQATANVFVGNVNVSKLMRVNIPADTAKTVR